MKRLNNNKGFSLIELLVVIAVFSMSTPLIFWIFSYGIQSYSSYSKYIGQQYKVMDVTQRIRKDIEESAVYKISDPTDTNKSVLTLWIPDDDTNIDTFSIRIWKFEKGKLYLKNITGNIDDGKTAMQDDVNGYMDILDGLDTSIVTASTDYMRTRFENIDQRILLSIKPVEDNKVVSKNRNVTKPVVTEFSVQYKEKIN